MNLITRLTEAGAVLSIPSDGGPCPLHGIALDPIWGSLSWVPGATHMPLSLCASVPPSISQNFAFSPMNSRLWVESRVLISILEAQDTDQQCILLVSLEAK